jgi:biotin-dependent carboxylase-like uncharacterized protein
VHGGFAVPAVMGSRSTYVRGGFGGHAGRALRKGDVLPLGAGVPAQVYPQRGAVPAGAGFVAVDVGPLPTAAGASPRVVRVVAGQQWDAFGAEAQHCFVASSYRLSPQSDRMGLRFDGPALALREPLEMISEAVAFGTVQVPPDGKPIVLMADRQTTGGYPKIAAVASVDLPRLAQLAPLDDVRFERVTLAQAQQLDLAREAAFADLGRHLATLRS